MKCGTILLVAAGLVSSALSGAVADDGKVIANSGVKADTISAAELKSVFLEEKRALGDGIHVEPVLEKDGPVHQWFLREYLGRTDDDLQNYYRVLVFTGRGSIPKNLGSDAEVVAYVARTRGAIGYVSATASTEGVKTLVVGVTSNAAARKLITQVAPQYPETLKLLKIGGTVRLRITIAPRATSRTSNCLEVILFLAIPP